MTHINGTPIRFVKPFHALSMIEGAAAPMIPAATHFQPRNQSNDGMTPAATYLTPMSYPSRAAYLDGSTK
jgi:hypothetical protein